MRYGLIILLMALCRPAVAQPPNINDFYDGFLAPLSAQGKSIFFTSCRLQNTITAILYFPVGEAEGRYAEFSSVGTQNNGATISLTPELSADDLMGGMGYREIAMAAIRSLSKSRFELISPSDFKRALTAKPKARC